MRFQVREVGSAAGMIWLGVIATFAAVASAAPTITFPLNSQVPPVARIGQPFTFAFSPSTFTSDTAINYTINNAPAWLSLDGGTRKLSGTPPKDAPSAFTVDIEATDATGSTVMSSTLVVLSGAAPEISIPLSDQIDKFGGDVSAPSSLLFLPSTSFSFSFDPATFSTSGNDGLNRYAVTLDNAPLPSWITFDAAEMKFSGKTPDSGSLISPPEPFGIQLIASEVIGFGELYIPFFFVVENHKLVWEKYFLAITSSAGSAIDFKELAGKLELDGELAASSDLASVESDGPEWLKFDKSTFAISGTVPSNTSSLNFTVTAVDKFDDVAAVMINIAISSGTFKEQDIAPLNATIGEPFSFNVSTAFVDLAKVDISTSIVPETSWLSYNSETFVLSGKVPDSAAVSSVTVTLSAKSKSGVSKRADDSKSFTINIVSAPTETPSSTETSASASATASTAPPATSTAAAIAQPSESTNGINAGQIAAAVVVPNLVLILAVLLVFWCWRRRQHRQLIEKATFVPMKKDISRPQLHDPPALLTPSSTSSVHQGLRSYHLGSSDDTSIFTRPEQGRRSLSMQKVRRSISNMTSNLRSNPLRRSTSDNYITYGLPSISSTQAHDRLSKLSTTQTPKKKRDSDWRYHPYNFSDHTDTSGSIQITPEASYIHNYGQYRISKPKTRNWLGSIAGLPSQRGSIVGHGRNMSSVSNQTYDTPVRHAWAGYGGSTARHDGPGGASIDSGKTWLTVTASPRKSVGRGRPNSTMSAVTENTDLLYEYSDLPRLPPPVLTSSSDRGSSNNPNTIRIVSHSSDRPERFFSSKTLESSNSSINRPRTRRGGTSPFFGGSGHTNSRSARRRSAKVIEGYLFAAENSPSIAERDETIASLERSILSELNMDSSSMASRSNSRAKAGRDVFGINYGGQTPDMVSKTRKSRLYIPGYKSPEESNKQLQSFITDIRHRPSWQESRQPSMLSPSNLSDASSRFREATNSPPAFTYRNSYTEDDKENEDAMSRYSPETKEYAREAWKNKYTSYTSNFSARSLGAGTFRDSMGNSIRYDDEDSPQLTSAAYIERPSMLTPYSSHFGGSVYSRTPGPLSAGMNPSWRLTPVSPRPVDLGAGRVKEGPARSPTLRQSHGREGSLSIASFLENGGQGEVPEEGEWERRTEERRKRAEREHTPGQAFL